VKLVSRFSFLQPTHKGIYQYRFLGNRCGSYFQTCYIPEKGEEKISAWIDKFEHPRNGMLTVSLQHMLHSKIVNECLLQRRPRGASIMAFTAEEFHQNFKLFEFERKILGYLGLSYNLRRPHLITKQKLANAIKCDPA